MVIFYLPKLAKVGVVINCHWWLLVVIGGHW